MCFWCSTIDLCLRSVSQAWIASSTCQLTAYNFGTQLETDRSCEFFITMSLIILEDLRRDVKFLTGSGQGQE